MGEPFSWPALGAEVARNRFGHYVAARQWYATPAMCEPDRLAIELLLHSRAADNHVPASHASDPEKWLFLDTEATGFIGGAGNLAFLIGLAWWDSGGIQIEQLFMRDAPRNIQSSSSLDGGFGNVLYSSHSTGRASIGRCW